MPDGHNSIMDLPDDCLCLIFQGLDNTSDRNSFGLTCHRWLNIQNISRRTLQFECSLTQLCHSSLSLNNLKVTPSHVNKLLTRFQHLLQLSLSCCTVLPDSGLLPLQLYGAKLQTLLLDCCFKITDDGLSLIGHWCPSLTSISLYQCFFTDEGLENLANACPTLMNVNLSYCSNITDRGLQALTRKCRHLRAVTVSFCRGVVGIGFKGCSPTLAYIDAEDCKLEPEGIMGVVSGGGMECLNISGISRLCGGDLAAIGSGFAARLRILNIRKCRNVGDESIMAIAKRCPLLQEWNLTLCHQVKISGWESIGANCNNLEKLHVNRCRNLSDRGLQALREGCRRLLVLYINQNDQISGMALELFKLYRGEVKIIAEEIMCVGPDWLYR